LIICSVTSSSSSPSSINGTSNGQARLLTRTLLSAARSALSYAPLRIVARVPITPMCRLRVACNAARAPGSITPITGNNKRLRVLPRQDPRQFHSVALHGFRAFRPVRNTRRVAQIKNVFVWQQVAQCLHDSKAADARIENANGARITHAAGTWRLEPRDASTR